MGENHSRVALQSRHVTLAKVAGAFCRDQEKNGLVYQGVNTVACQGFLGVESFIDSNDQLGYRSQPGEPRITGKKLKKMMRRVDGADVGLVNRAFGFDQYLVQIEQRIAKVQQGLPDGQLLRLSFFRSFLFHRIIISRLNGAASA